MVLLWRTGASVAWAVCLMVPFTFLAITLARISILSPYAWISGVVCSMLTPSAWLQLLLLGAVVVLVALLNTRYYTVRPACPSSRLEEVLCAVSLSRVVHLAVSAFCGGAVAWLYTRLLTPDSAYYGLTTPCSHSKLSGAVCVNELHLFLVLHAVFAGALFSLFQFRQAKHQLVFPIIQQSKFFQVKSKLWALSVSSFSCTVKFMVYFYLLYYILLGHAVKARLSETLGIYEDLDDVPINSILGMLDLSLFWNSCLSVSLLHLLFSLPALLYNVYHTEHFVFPVETALEDFKDKCLYNALACESHPLIQYLGYQDLYMSAQHSLKRRKEVFSLTQLGGHPLNWSRICKECLCQLSTFTDAISAFNMQVLAKGSMRHSSGETTYKETWNGNAVTTLTQRNTTSSLVESKEVSETVTSKEDALSKINKGRMFSYFLDEHPDQLSRKLFSDSQRYTWTVCALSYLVCASFTEDTYGVVQQSLQTVLRQLLSLSEALDRHMKLGITPGWKSNGRSSVRNAATSSQDIHRKLALRAALKSGLYRITTTFHQHLDSLSLSGEEKRRLHLYLEYKE